MEPDCKQANIMLAVEERSPLTFKRSDPSALCSFRKRRMLLATELAPECIELFKVQRRGKNYIPRIRSGSDPSCRIGTDVGQQISITRSHTSLHNGTLVENDDSGTSLSERIPPPSRISQLEPVSFERMIKQTSPEDQWQQQSEAAREPYRDINAISEGERERLHPLLWLELSSLFAKNNVSLDKVKRFKRKRKEEKFSVFGVSLNALVRRELLMTGDATTLVPRVLQAILAELAVRGLREEGILRVPGHKQKIEALYNEIEHKFYSKPEKVRQLIKQAGVHELSALLKRWLRELPQPLLANDLVHLFYQTNVLPPHEQCKALTILCQLLPEENRNTLRELLNFCCLVVEQQNVNKMTQQNVARILAPSLFPPRFVDRLNQQDIGAQVRMAVHCCHLTNVLITMSDSIWLVPQRLIEEAKMMKKNGRVSIQQI
uniref:Rho-GAP domain-containing protein n=1 Tax=Anopheles epiroticus TaxID=199890 RepID=A0A182P5X2_9DIPT